MRISTRGASRDGGLDTQTQCLAASNHLFPPEMQQVTTTSFAIDFALTLQPRQSSTPEHRTCSVHQGRQTVAPKGSILGFAFRSASICRKWSWPRGDGRFARVDIPKMSFLNLLTTAPTMIFCCDNSVMGASHTMTCLSNPNIEHSYAIAFAMSLGW